MTQKFLQIPSFSSSSDDNSDVYCLPLVDIGNNTYIQKEKESYTNLHTKLEGQIKEQKEMFEEQNNFYERFVETKFKEIHDSTMDILFTLDNTLSFKTILNSRTT